MSNHQGVSRWASSLRTVARSACRLAKKLLAVIGLKRYRTASSTAESDVEAPKRSATNSPSPQGTFVTQLDTADFSVVYQRFAAVIGEATWVDHIQKVNAAIKGCPTLQQFLRGENEIPYALSFIAEGLKQHGAIAVPMDQATTLLPAISFAAQALSMIDLYGPVEGERFRCRVADALTNADSMRGLRLEMMVVTHFQRRGHRPEWPEHIGAGTFDLLFPEYGPLGLEVECKAVSDDKGRSVHIEEALRFINLLLERKVYDGVPDCVGVSLTLSNRMPTSIGQRAALADAVRRCIEARAGEVLSDGTEIKVSVFDSAELAALDRTSRDSVRGFIQRLTGTDNRQGILVYSQQGGAVAFAVQSAKDDTVLKTIFDTLKDASKRQLTKTRPGVLVAGLYGLSDAELRSVADQDHDPSQAPTELAVHVSQFLRNANRQHLVGASFVSRGVLMPRVDGNVDSGGAAYNFINDKSPMWDEAFRGMFSPDAD